MTKVASLTIEAHLTIQYKRKKDRRKSKKAANRRKHFWEDGRLYYTILLIHGIFTEVHALIFGW